MSPGVLHSSEGYFEGVGRLRLRYRAWEVQNARAAILVVHGLGEHSGRYAAFAETAGAFACSTYALDLRGHGGSEGRRGFVPRFETFLQDVDRFRREVQGLVDVRVPVFLLGNSMGGLIALRYLEEYEAPFRGAIIVSPWLATAVEVPRWKVLLANALNRMLPALPFNNGIDPAALCHDPAVVEAYRSDPLVHHTITPRLFFEASRAMGLVFQRSSRIQVPLLFLIAGADLIVQPSKAVSFARSLAAPDVTVRVYPEYYHEVLNEPGNAPVLVEIRDWIVQRAG